MSNYANSTRNQTALYPKYMVDGTHEGAPIHFGPFDTEEKADRALATLTDATVSDAKVTVIYTVSSVSIFAKEHTPKSETVPVAPAPEPEPEPAKPAPRRRTRKAATAKASV